MSDADKLAAGIAAPVGGVMTECGTNPPVEHILSAEDAVSFSSLLSFNDIIVLSFSFCRYIWLALNVLEIPFHLNNCGTLE
jgi:hypothetical protein